MLIWLPQLYILQLVYSQEIWLPTPLSTINPSAKPVRATQGDSLLRMNTPLKVPYHKNKFSLVSTYITPRMRKTSNSCMVSAAHPLVTQCSYMLFRICSFRYVKKGVIIIGRPPLPGDRRYLRVGRSSPRWSSVSPAVRQQCFMMSSLKSRHANSSVVGCQTHHKCLYSVPATELQKRQWLRFIF